VRVCVCSLLCRVVSTTVIFPQKRWFIDSECVLFCSCRDHPRTAMISFVLVSTTLGR
jgi:hypothetical protein